MSQAELDQLTNLGSSLLGPLTTQIVQILTTMQSNIDTLNRRIEVLEGEPSQPSQPNTTEESKPIPKETQSVAENASKSDDTRASKSKKKRQKIWYNQTQRASQKTISQKGTRARTRT
eukprot:342956_1